MPPKLVIFDCDGVLVDSEMIASRELAAYLTQLGRPTDADECRTVFTGISIKSVAEHVQRNWGLALPDDFVEHLRTRDRLAFDRELKIIPGVKDVLRQLSAADIQFCVASSGTPDKIHHSLKLTGLISLLESRIFSASQVKNGKPAPDLFALAAQKMGVAAKDCLVIEDAVPGVKGAKAAGMVAFGFTGGSHCTPKCAQELLDAGAINAFNEMSQLSKLVGF